MSSRLSRSAALIAALALAAVAAPVSAADTAMVRVIHASPDAPEVDVFANDAKVAALSGVVFGEVTDYAAIPAGTYTIKVCATADNTVCPITVDLTFEAGKKHTVAASNLLAQIQPDMFVDGGAVDGKAKARVIHLSADTPNVDVLTQDGTQKVFADIEYREATDYLPLAAGSYDLKVCATADNSVCPLDPEALPLAAGTAYTVFAIGSLEGGDGVEALTYAVGVDGKVAPATDTVGAATTSTTSPALPLLLLAVGLASLLGVTRLATSRARR